MNLYYNTTAQCRVDEFNTRIAAKPVIHYGACPTWELHFYSGDAGESPVPVDLSDIVSWRAAVDSDWNSSTEPMCRTLAVDIDSSRKSVGIISVPVNANTQRYLTVVNGKQSVSAWFELRGFDDQGNVAIVVLLNITCSNSIDPDGGAAPAPVDNDTATMTWVKAEIAQQLYYEYSADGSAWHNPPMIPDTDVYFRIRHGSDGTPSAALLIPYGPQGPTGDDGITPHVGDNGNWWIGNTDTGIKAGISGSFSTFDAVTNNRVTFAISNTVPVGVLTSAGHYYGIEKGSLTVDTVNHTFTLDVTPYLAYDNAASFSGTWRVYMAAGPTGATGSPGSVTAAGALLFQTSGSAGHGGYLDFHYNGSEAITARLINNAAGNLLFSYVNNVQMRKYLNGNTSMPITYDLMVPLGGIIQYIASGALQGFLVCDGSAVSRTTYAELFAVIGTAFGSGDGSTTFNLPDFTASDVTGLAHWIRY